MIINADIVQLTSNDRINAGTGHVTIQPATAGRKIDLGSTTDVAAGTLEQGPIICSICDGEFEPAEGAANDQG